MRRCDERHPDEDGACTLPPGSHWEHEDAAGRRWANEAVQEAVGRRTGATGGIVRAREIARTAAPRASAPMDPPVAPPVEPAGAAALVLEHLRARAGQWSTGAELAVVAGPAGPHQPGELRGARWAVESRLRGGVWEHRVRRPSGR